MAKILRSLCGNQLFCGAEFRDRKRMNLLLVLLFAFLFNVHTSWAAQSDSELLQQIQSTTDASAQAKLYKVLGDHYVTQDKFDLAADAFANALALGRDLFSATERVQMAVYLSWADRLRESERELRAVLARDPKNLHARTHLARVLSWSGELSEAVAEADKVLKESPENREALLIKADALLWKGRATEAAQIYQPLATKGNDFDARVGLAHIYLATGNRLAAEQAAAQLNASSFPQQRELDKLNTEIFKATRPTLDTRYLYYRDSDNNHYNRYIAQFGFWIRNLNLAVNYRHTDADQDGHSRNRAEDLSLSLYSSLTETVRIGGGMGFNQLSDGKTTHFPIGHVKIDADFLNGTIGAQVTREVLSDTTQLIKSGLRVTAAGMQAAQALTDRLSVSLGYTFKTYSDGNHAHDAQLTNQYTLFFDPKISVGYRFRYLNFDRQSGSGLFDPNDYLSNRLFSSFYAQKQKYYAYAEAYIGQQSFHRNGVQADDLVYGGAASFGLTPTRHLTIEVYGEGGNLASGSAAGFTYFMVGPRIIFRF
jgi:thioredoxin-like negative regulator of GroEL